MAEEEQPQNVEVDIKDLRDLVRQRLFNDPRRDQILAGIKKASEKKAAEQKRTPGVISPPKVAIQKESEQTVSRRGWLKYLGAGGAGVILGGGGRYLKNLVENSSEIPVRDDIPRDESSLPANTPLEPRPTSLNLGSHFEKKQVKQFKQEAKDDLLSKEQLKFSPQEYFGIRNDMGKLMVYAKNLGAASVRIDGGGSEIVKIPDPKKGLKVGELAYEGRQQALDEAKRLGLSILYQYNPQELIDGEQIRDNLASVIEKYNVTVELGNEPDDKNPYWKDKDLKTFARFIARAAKVITGIDKEIERKTAKKHQTKIVVGALVDQERTEELLLNIRSQMDSTLDMGNLIYAIHAYHDSEEVLRRAKSAKQALIKVLGKERGEKARLMFTEVGVDTGDKSAWTLAEMYKRARELSQNQPVFIHELPKTEQFGLVDPQTGECSEDYKVLGELIGVVEKAIKKEKPS